MDDAGDPRTADKYEQVKRLSGDRAMCEDGENVKPMPLGSGTGMAIMTHYHGTDHDGPAFSTTLLLSAPHAGLMKSGFPAFDTDSPLYLMSAAASARNSGT